MRITAFYLFKQFRLFFTLTGVHSQEQILTPFRSFKVQIFLKCEIQYSSELPYCQCFSDAIRKSEFKPVIVTQTGNKQFD